MGFLPSIASDATRIYFALLKGQPPEPAQTVERLERAGVDGFGAREGPIRARLERLHASCFVATIAHARSTITAIRKLEGKLVTVTDENQTTHPNVLIELAQATMTPKKVRYLEPEGLFDRWRVDAVFDVIRHPGG